MSTMSQFEKSSDQSFQFDQAELAPGAGARFGFVPGVAPQMGDLPALTQKETLFEAAAT